MASTLTSTTRLRLYLLFSAILLGALADASSGLPSYTTTTDNTSSAVTLPVDHLEIARLAVDDLLQHFWVGDEVTGHILDTWNGYARPSEFGVLWERAQLLRVLVNLFGMTGDPVLRQRIAADWAYTRQRCPRLDQCGRGTSNPQCDDAGWAMSMYLDVYDCTGDENALTAARVLFGRTLERFSDGQMGGGLRYAQESDERQSYQAAVILAGLRLAAAAKDPTFRDRAMALYDWTEKYMRRTDGLYWCSYRGPDPQRTARAPREAASDTFLGGNMCMAVINAMVYNETKQEIYLQRALDTANGILAHETSASGELLNDRDAWTNAFFAGEWMRNVTTLPGAPSRLRRVVEQTALSIWQKARTEKGLFGACWDGPAEGDGCTWWKQGSKPEQIMVSSNSVNVIVAAAEPGRGSSG